MAFFTSRQSGDSSGPAARQPESVETLRRRAKHRLIGAVVLVLAGVVGFPLLFDSQPRPVPVDIQIDMPDKARVAPLQIPGNLDTPASNVASGSVGGSANANGAVGNLPSAVPAKPAESKVVAAASLDDKEQLVGKDAAKEIPKPVSKPERKPEPKPIAKADPKVDDSARAKTKSPDADLRLVIQVGAFAEADKAQEVRLKLEHAGLKTYTHVAETKEGKRIRVRVGPFSTHAEADKVASKVKALQLPASILTL